MSNKVMYRCWPEQSIGSAVYHKLIRVHDAGYDDLVICIQMSCDHGDEYTSGGGDVIAIPEAELTRRYAPTTKEADAMYAKEAEEMERQIAATPF